MAQDLTRRVVLELLAKNRAAGELAAFQGGIARVNTAIMSVGRSVLAFAGLGGGIYAVQRGLRFATDAARVQEKAERDLAAALGTTDMSAGGLVDSFKKYAAQLQRQTIYGDEEILNQIAYAKNLGVTTDKLREATMAAIGLSAKYRIDLQSAMMLVGRASQGQTQTLTRYGIVLDQTLTKEEQFEQLLKIGKDSFGLAEEAARNADGTWRQFKNAVGDLAEELGGPFLSAMTKSARAMTDSINKTKELAAATEEYRRQVGDPRRMQWVQSPGEWGGRFVEAPVQYPKILDMFKAQAAAGKPVGLFPPQSVIDEATELRRQAAGGAAEVTKLTDEQMRKVIQDTREAMESVRHQDYLTRRERIESLRIYQAANADTLAEVAEANRLLNAEILSLERSRLNQIEVYYAEMRERAQEPYLTAMEYAANFARQAQSDWATMWDPVIDGTKTAKEAMNDFFRTFFLNLAKAQLQMAMMRVWDNAVGPAVTKFASAAFGNLFGAGSSVSPTAATGVHVAHQGWRVGMEPGPVRWVDPAIFADAPRFHDLGPGEVAVIAQKGEEIRRPGGDQPAIVNNFYTNIKAMDSQDVRRALAKEKNFFWDLSAAGYKSNHALRRIQS